MGQLRSWRGYTLLELIVTIFIIGVIAAIGVPFYSSSIDKSKARSACQTLRVIRNNERTYKLEKGGYLAISENDPDSQWNAIQMDNPNVLQAHTGYKFSVEPGSSFRAKARREKDNGTYLIVETGVITNPDGKLPPVTY